MSADSTTVTRRSDLPIQHTTRYTQLSAAPFKDFWSRGLNCSTFALTLPLKEGVKGGIGGQNAAAGERIMPRIFLASVTLASITAVALVAVPAFAATVRTTLRVATPAGPGAEVGTAMINDSPQGAMITLDLHGLPPGQRGMHVHQNGSCAASIGPDSKPVPAGAAGEHFDPVRSGRHMGPEGPGHLGDLPRVDVAGDGTARENLNAPRIKDVSVLKGRALIVHAGGDTYSEPPPNGGGGARFACGVLE